MFVLTSDPQKTFDDVLSLPFKRPSEVATLTAGRVDTVIVKYKGKVHDLSNDLDIHDAIEKDSDLGMDEDLVHLTDAFRKTKDIEINAKQDAISTEQRYFDMHVEKVAKARDVDVMVVKAGLESAEVVPIFPTMARTDLEDDISVDDSPWPTQNLSNLLDTAADESEAKPESSPAAVSLAPSAKKGESFV